MLERLISQLGQELDMKDLISSLEDRHYLLPFNDDIEIEAIEQGQRYLLKGIIGPYPQNNKEEFFLTAMEANLFGRGTRGMVIGLNEDGKLLTLSVELDYNCPYKEFKEKLEDLISVLDYWRQAALK